MISFFWRQKRSKLSMWKNFETTDCQIHWGHKQNHNCIQSTAGLTGLLINFLFILLTLAQEKKILNSTMDVTLFNWNPNFKSCWIYNLKTQKLYIILNYVQ